MGKSKIKVTQFDKFLYWGMMWFLIIYFLVGTISLFVFFINLITKSENNYPDAYLAYPWMLNNNGQGILFIGGLVLFFLICLMFYFKYSNYYTDKVRIEKGLPPLPEFKGRIKNADIKKLSKGMKEAFDRKNARRLAGRFCGLIFVASVAVCAMIYRVFIIQEPPGAASLFFVVGLVLVGAFFAGRPSLTVQEKSSALPKKGVNKLRNKKAGENDITEQFKEWYKQIKDLFSVLSNEIDKDDLEIKRLKKEREILKEQNRVDELKEKKKPKSDLEEFEEKEKEKFEQEKLRRKYQRKEKRQKAFEDLKDKVRMREEAREEFEEGKQKIIANVLGDKSIEEATPEQLRKIAEQVESLEDEMYKIFDKEV